MGPNGGSRYIKKENRDFIYSSIVLEFYDYLGTLEVFGSWTFFFVVKNHVESTIPFPHGWILHPKYHQLSNSYYHRDLDGHLTPSYNSY